MEDDGVECSVRLPEGNGDIVRFSGRPGTGVSLSAFDLATYSNRNRELVKTNVDVRAKMKTCLGEIFVLRWAIANTEWPITSETWDSMVQSHFWCSAAITFRRG